VAKNNARKAATGGRLSVEEVRALMRKSGGFTKKQIDDLTEESLKKMPRRELSKIKPLSGPFLRVKAPGPKEVVRVYVGTDVEIDETKRICRWRGPGCRNLYFSCKADHVSYKLLKAPHKTAFDCRFGNPLWEIFIWAQ
jgi:hypothetical protein